jgi:hypothetical protein
LPFDPEASGQNPIIVQLKVRFKSTLLQLRAKKHKEKKMETNGQKKKIKTTIE